MLKRTGFAILLVAVLASAASAADLPLKRVVLFSSGVGYFSREGSVDGNATVPLSFRTAQINDILKSMVLQDFDGGTIAPVTYAPQEPLERTLSSFAVNIADNPSLSELLDRLRGVKAEVKADVVRAGTVLGMEEQQKSAGENNILTFQVLNLLTDAGIVQIPIWHIKSVRILDARVDSDLQAALKAIAAGRDVDKRPVTLTFNGKGMRRVSVGYLIETPVWKTSYRLVRDDKGLFLQGWAIVENTTDEDWPAVGLSLISGRPISFIQNLYEPLYVERPIVAPSVAASPKPQVYEGAMEEAAPAEAEAAAKEPRARRARPAPAAPPAPGMMAAGGMMGPGMGGGGGFGGAGQVAALATTGAAAMAQGEKVGELFQYEIDQPVTIGRQKSAMIPIVNKMTEGEKVSVYNATVNPKFPLNGVKLKNTTGLHLMGGPITVFDEGVYAGDALIDDIAPGDERLLTYAVDLGVEVEQKGEGGPEDIMSVKIARGTVVITRKQQMKVIYTAKSVSAEKKALLIEHPLRPDWTLVEPKEPDERTRSVYRFRVPLDPKATQKLTVIEEHEISQAVALTDANADQVAAFLVMPKLSDATKQALQRVVELKTQLAAIQRDRAEREARLQEIGTEQERIRKNMEQLDRNSELYKRYVQKFTDQETEFEKLQGEIQALKAGEDKKLQEIQDFIVNLSVD
jgi:hypothetical protein